MYVIEVPFLNLEKTFVSGQNLRWRKLKENKFIVIYGDKAVKVEQQRQRLVMACNNDDFYDIWFDYFDLRYDYSKANRIIKKQDAFLQICAVKEQGVRIIRQDLFEVIITQMLVENMPVGYQTQELIESLCEQLGVEHKQSMREAGKVTWYEFPTAEALINNKQIIESLFWGKSDKVISICKMIREGWLDLELLQYMRFMKEFENIKQYLTSFEEISDNVAEKICLYGLYSLMAKPKNSLQTKQLNNMYGFDEDDFCEWFDDLSPVAGLALQYVQANAISEKIKEGNLIWE